MNINKRALSCLLFLISLNSYAGTCMSNIPASNPDEMYSVHLDGTVTDTRTGLMWKVCAEGQTWSAGACAGTPASTTYVNAISQADASTYGGHTDWRLPNAKELLSLTEECRYEPAINNAVFPSTAFDNSFWSNTMGYSVNFRWGYGGGGTGVSLDSEMFVRFVRGGQ